MNVHSPHTEACNLARATGDGTNPHFLTLDHVSREWLSFFEVSHSNKRAARPLIPASILIRNTMTLFLGFRTSNHGMIVASKWVVCTNETPPIH